MHTNEIIILATSGVAIVGGIACGAFAKPAAFKYIRVCAIVSVLVHAAFLAVATFVAQSFSDHSSFLKLLIFFGVAASAILCVFAFLSGFVGVFRKVVRLQASIVAGISLLIIPVFLAITTLSRALK